MKHNMSINADGERHFHPLHKAPIRIHCIRWLHDVVLEEKENCVEVRIVEKAGGGSEVIQTLPLQPKMEKGRGL